jgi:transcriptional regulator with XRE-family HTH domain
VRNLLTPQVAPVLLKCRKASGMTQKELAEILMIDPSYVSKIENGHAVPDAVLYNNWIAVTKGPVLVFTYVFGEWPEGPQGTMIAQTV